MPPFGPIKRNGMIRTLKKLKFEGPFSGGKHQYMIRNKLRLTIPNQHQGDISRELLAKILHQIGIEKEEWEKL
jgi:predicted RNA binding protein YcfA (HicA-like mRNA interferase family)